MTGWNEENEDYESETEDSDTVSDSRQCLMNQDRPMLARETDQTNYTK
jgi:hypothetical protein